MYIYFRIKVLKYKKTVCSYIYICVCVCVYIYIYIYLHLFISIFRVKFEVEFTRQAMNFSIESVD